MRTKLLVLLVMCLIFIVPAQNAMAHVLVSDTTGKTGAILHITPDDDPVAGVSAGMFYEIETKQDLNQAALHLQVTDETGGISESVLMTGKGSSVYGAFIFPQRGLYKLDLTIVQKVNGPKVTPLTFVYSVRITKGTRGSDPQIQAPAWASFGLIMSVWASAVCIILVVLRRKKIVKQSK